MAIAIQDAFLAAGVVQTPAGVPSFVDQSGNFAGTIVKNGVGDYTLTLIQGSDNAQSITTVQVYGTVQIDAMVERPTDETIRVRLYDDGGAPIDSGFSIRVDRFK